MRSHVNQEENDFNIILITIDTLRADHLSCYGYDRNTSPNIDKIAQEGVLFTNAIASSSWTLPSMASIMTSLYPISHGVRTGVIKSGKVYNQDILSDEFTTLAQLLKSNGYETFGAVANVHMSKELGGFDRGFDYYYCEGFDKAPRLNDVILSWKEKIVNSQKYFLWLHYFDPHHYYNPRNPWFSEYSSGLKIDNLPISTMTMDELKALIPELKEKKDLLSYLIALYDSEINFVDHYIGNLIRKLKPDENTMIIITSDHGEEFLDHGSLGHSHTLYQELIHVPLIIKMPISHNEKSFSKIYKERVSIVDIMPTILGKLEIDPPAQAVGKDLFDEYNLSKKEDKNNGIFSKVASWSVLNAIIHLFDEYNLSKKQDKNNDIFSEVASWNVLNAIIRENWKYIYDTCTQKSELYDISHDQKELNNLIHQAPAIADELKRDIYRWASASLHGTSIKKEIQPSKEIEEKLKSLGYIGDDGQQEELKGRKYDDCNLGNCHVTTN
jgi:arylsulfatase A-like enzyme